VLNRLYVARSTAITLVDLATGGPATSIGTISRGHAVLPLAGGTRLLVTSGNDASVRILDTATGKELVNIPVGKKPDAAILDETRKRVLVMNSVSGTISVIDVATATVVRTIQVKPALEYAAIANDGTLFVNDEDANEIETIDVDRGTMGQPIALPGCEGPTGLGYDAPHDRLISACGNGKAAIVDAHQRKVVAMLDIGHGADAVIVDAARRLAFIPGGEDGVLDILSLDGPGGIAVTDRVTTEIGARTGALDPATGALYLPTARMTPPAKPGARPSPVPGSFHIIVVRPA
jgi:YVTN family beta-propeller protein